MSSSGLQSAESDYRATLTEHGCDEALTDAFKRGDQQALATMIARNHGRLRRLIELRLDARVRARVSPSDVLQETFVEALKRFRHFRTDPDVPIFIWLRTVVIQRLIDVHRQHLQAKVRNAGKEVPICLAGGNGGSSETMAVALLDLSSPSQKVERAEVVASVREALESLDPLDCDVLVLRHLEERNNREVASALGISPAAASKRHIRALERFRKEVAKSMSTPRESA